MIDDESWWWCGIHQKKYLRIALIDYWRNDDYEHSDDDEDGVDDDVDDKGDYYDAKSISNKIQHKYLHDHGW